MAEPSNTTVRKSAFGRTSLFLTGDERVLVRTIRTVSSAMRRNDGSIYHNLSSSSSRVKDIHCWHCCEKIKGESFFVPKAFDSTEKVFHVYGHFDSLECAKAFIVEQSSFDHGHQMNMFTKMVREVYGIEEDIWQAPPRITLQKFGGPFDITKFKKKPFKSRIIEPPFVSYCMLAEERPTETFIADTLGSRIDDDDVKSTVDDDEFAEPPPISMYDTYLQEHATDDVQNTSTSEPAKKKRNTGSSSGNLSKFMKKP